MSKFIVTAIERVKHTIMVDADDAMHASKVVDSMQPERISSMEEEWLDVRVVSIVQRPSDCACRDHSSGEH